MNEAELKLLQVFNALNKAKADAQKEMRISKGQGTKTEMIESAMKRISYARYGNFDNESLIRMIMILEDSFAEIDSIVSSEFNHDLDE